MAEAWTELLRDLVDDDFISAVKIHMRDSRYFPVPADILKAHESARPNRPPVLELPEVTFGPEERRKAAVCGAMLRASINGSQRAKEFFDTTDDEQREEIARQVLGAGYPVQDHRRVMQ